MQAGALRGGYARGGACVQCCKESGAARYAANPERAKEWGRKRYEANKPEIIAQAKAWHAANPEKSKASRNKYQAANRARVNAAIKAWKEANPERIRESARVAYHRNPEKSREKTRKWGENNRQVKRACFRRWAAANPDRMRAHGAMRRAVVLQRCPAWADVKAINAIYAEATRKTKETGEQWDVDHIVPLRGRFASGLHVPWNLQVIRHTDNIKKHNTFVPYAVHYTTE